MTGNPRVTVGIPTWNRAELLRACLQSIFDQTMQDFEIWVFDNASEDHTTDVVASFDDPRLHYVRNDVNLGNQKNSTMALRAGTGEYVALVFDDDLLLPTCLERKARFLDEHPEVVLVHSAFEARAADGVTVKVPWMTLSELKHDTIESGREFIERSFDVPNRIRIGSFLARREAVRSEGLFPEDLPLDEHPLWCRIATRGGMAFIAEPLDVMRFVEGVSTRAGYLELEDGVFKTTFELVRETKAIMLKFLDEYDVGPGEERYLRHLNRRHARRWAARLIGQRIQRAWPPGPLLHALVEAVKIDPMVLVEPRLAKSLLLIMGRELRSLRSES